MIDAYLVMIVRGKKAPDVAVIRDKGRHLTALGKYMTEFAIMGLGPGTTYEAYGPLHDTLNNKDTEPELLFTFTTIHIPT